MAGANSDIGKVAALGFARACADVVVNSIAQSDAADPVTSATPFVDGGITLDPGFGSGG